MIKEALELSLDDLVLYCCCYEQHYPFRTQYSQKNLMCGASSLNEGYISKLRKYNYLLDYSGNNISHLNKYFSDLTGLYWIYKNTNHKFVGVNQYRRFWDEEQLKSIVLRNDTLYIREVSFNQSVMEQYIEHHGEYGIDLLKYASNLQLIPIPLDFIDNLNKTNILYAANNLMFASGNVFYPYCQFIFECLFPLYDLCKDDIKDFHISQMRLMGFLAERIQTIFIMNLNYYCSGLNICSLNVEEIL